jgi:hypothetical protein
VTHLLAGNGRNEWAQNRRRRAWRNFLIELEFARDYPIAYQISGGIAVRNPVLERILPSLLHIKMAALLDEALETYLYTRNLPLPKKYRSTLDGRISFFSDTGQIQNGLELQAMRRRRNDLAHQSSSSASWSQLEQDVEAVQCALLQLRLVADRPRFEMNAERSAARNSQEPGTLCYVDYCVSLIEGGKTAAEVTWRQTIHTDAASQQST